MSTRNPLSNLPTEDELKNALGKFIWGYFMRMDSDPPTVHCLPLSTDYEAKRMANGEPLFVRVANAAGDPLVGDDAVPVEPPRLDYSIDTTTRRSGTRSRRKD